MIGVVMCGGKGTRIKSDIEKPLFPVSGVPMVLMVVQAMEDSRCFEKVYAAVSPHTPATRKFLVSRGAIILDTPGADYSSDLSWVLAKLKPVRVFAISADMPLINTHVISEIAAVRQEKAALAVVLEKTFLESLGVVPSSICNNAAGFCYSGISIFDTSKYSQGYVEERRHVLNKIEVAINVNTKEEAELAEKLLVQRTQDLA